MSQTAMAHRRRGRVLLWPIRRRAARGARRPALLARPLPAATTLALALGLAACNPFRSEPPPPLPCPRAAVLDDADTFTAYVQGADRVRENARYYGALTDIASACRYGDGGVAVDLRVALFAEKGAAYEGGPVRLPYFVAVVGPGRTVIAREALTAEIAIPASALRTGVAEDLTQTIPGMTPEDAPAYRILVGFQLGEADVRQRRPLGGGP